jgi:hypothetical protein
MHAASELLQASPALRSKRHRRSMQPASVHRQRSSPSQLPRGSTTPDRTQHGSVAPTRATQTAGSGRLSQRALPAQLRRWPQPSSGQAVPTAAPLVH